MHRTLSGFASTIDHHGLHQDIPESSFISGGGSGGGGVGSESHLIRSLLCNLSILKEKVHDIESFLSIFLAQENNNFHPSYNLSVDQSMAFSNTIHDIVETASSMKLSFQQMIFESNYDHSVDLPHNSMQSFVHDHDLFQFNDGHKGTEQGFYDGDNLYTWYLQNPTNYFYNNTNSSNVPETSRSPTTSTTNTMEASQNYEVVELEAADLLARYTHCCQVCGRGFKREANLKMHMRAHGDHYKTSLISNNTSNNEENKNMVLKKYSCPQEGCRWNKKHSKFQPLKSIVCVRNHYKRTHCHKMFMCKRCNLKQFSVLSDLKTHEKHCGDVKWNCCCGSSFSKKDKLMDHVGLFVGHTPLIDDHPVVSQLEGLNLQFS